MKKISVVYRKTADLIPYARNARTHSDEQVTQIASSIKEFGFNNPILIDGENGVIAGHGRLMAAKKLGLETVPTIELSELSEAQKKAYILADNKIALNSGWDVDLLKLELEELEDLDIDISLTGFDVDDIENLGIGDENDESKAVEDEVEIPQEVENPKSKIGDVFILGNHRVMCGDSTNADNVKKLTNGKVADFIHADPPYGLGKVADGVENDNIRKDELVKFQLAWFKAFRPFTIEKINVAIWGNAEELWRLWYGGLNKSEPDIRFVNEIVWDKPSQAGLNNSEAMSLVQCERCLLIQTGKQFIGNVNSCDFPETWRPILDCLRGMADSAGLTPKMLQEETGVSMYSHWFTTSQFTLIPMERYKILQKNHPEAFAMDYGELKKMWGRVRGNGREKLNAGLARAYFDATVDKCKDVWNFPTPTGNQRPDHPTPKALLMMERIIKICSKEGGIVLEPFGGSGQTLLAAERTNRACYCMELQPKFVDMIVTRWQEMTGKKAIRESDGIEFNLL